MSGELSIKNTHGGFGCVVQRDGWVVAMFTDEQDARTFMDAERLRETVKRVEALADSLQRDNDTEGLFFGPESNPSREALERARVIGSLRAALSEKKEGSA